MILRYPMTCQCGAECPVGTDVTMKRGPSPWPGVEGRWQVVSCPSCDDNRDRGAVVMQSQDIRPEKRGGTLKQQIEARRRKRAKVTR